MERETKIHDLEELLTVKEIEKYLKIGRAGVINLIHQGKLPAKKIGRVYRVKKSDLINFLNQKI